MKSDNALHSHDTLIIKHLCTIHKTGFSLCPWLTVVGRISQKFGKKKKKTTKQRLNSESKEGKY